jgi:hypothetical protein
VTSGIGEELGCGCAAAEPTIRDGWSASLTV